MAVANDTILQKMTRELEQAKQEQHNQPEMLKHIANIRLLCDLFLTEENSQTTSNPNQTEFSSVEIKAMVGEDKPGNSKQAQPFKKSVELDDEGNGDSIFDF
jgi:Family of unknown function (DUF5327)